MKKRYSLGRIVIFTILTMGMCGCSMNNNNVSKSTETEVILSERQRNILYEQGLSTEYDELTSAQQNAIVSIEEMLLYVENKYNTSFSYAGYTAESTLEKESMQAYPTFGYKEMDCFTITKIEDGYVDDYINTVVDDLFATYIYDGIKSYYADTEIRVFTEITETSLSDVPDDGAGYDGKVESSIWIFIDETTFANESTSSFKDVFVRFLNEHQLYGMTQIILLKDSKLSYLTNYNYTDYLSEEHYLSRDTVYVNKDTDSLP